MDFQYVPAVLTLAKKDKAIAVVDPMNDSRLHDSDWATGRVACAVKLAIAGGVDKARSLVAANIS